MTDQVWSSKWWRDRWEDWDSKHKSGIELQLYVHSNWSLPEDHRWSCIAPVHACTRAKHQQEYLLGIQIHAVLSASRGFFNKHSTSVVEWDMFDSQPERWRQIASINGDHSNSTHVASFDLLGNLVKPFYSVF